MEFLPARMSVHYVHKMPHGSEARALNSLEVKLQIVVTHCVSAEN